MKKTKSKHKCTFNINVSQILPYWFLSFGLRDFNWAKPEYQFLNLHTCSVLSALVFYNILQIAWKRRYRRVINTVIEYYNSTVYILATECLGLSFDVLITKQVSGISRTLRNVLVYECTGKQYIQKSSWVVSFDTNKFIHPLRNIKKYLYFPWISITGCIAHNNFSCIVLLSHFLKCHL